MQRRSLSFHVGSIQIVIQPMALVFFLSLTLFFDILILPWALDLHPLVHTRLAHHVIHTHRITQHAPFLTQQLAAALFLLLLIVATTVHELGHALALRRCAATDIRITFRALGGACTANARNTSPRATLFYAAAGPLATVIIILIFLIFLNLPLIPHCAKSTIWLSNALQVGIFIGNAVPFYRRTDGSVIVRSLRALV